MNEGDSERMGRMDPWSKEAMNPGNPGLDESR